MQSKYQNIFNRTRQLIITSLLVYTNILVALSILRLFELKRNRLFTTGELVFSAQEMSAGPTRERFGPGRKTLRLTIYHQKLALLTHESLQLVAIDDTKYGKWSCRRARTGWAGPRVGRPGRLPRAPRQFQGSTQTHIFLRHFLSYKTWINILMFVTIGVGMCRQKNNYYSSNFQNFYQLIENCIIVYST